VVNQGCGIPDLPITTSQPSVDGDPRAATFLVAVAEDGPLDVVGFPDVELTVSGTTVPLEDALAPVGDSIGDTEVFDQLGDAIGDELGPVGGIASGLGGTSEVAGLSDPSAHVFVKYVHREAGEVLNVQEGAIAVPLEDGEVVVDVPMPGLAYTIPEGDHLDLEVATHSLMHATGRVPALIDVAVEATVPTLGAAARPDDEGDSGSRGGSGR
jgi:hypothetical protein